MASLDFLSKREISDTYEPVDADVSRIEEIATQNVCVFPIPLSLPSRF